MTIKISTQLDTSPINIQPSSSTKGTHAKSAKKDKSPTLKLPSTLKHEEAGTYEGIDLGDVGLK